MNILKINRDELDRYLSIKDESIKLDRFYDFEVDVIKKEMANGIQRDDIPFDVTITKEQAYGKYCQCDMATAKNIANLISSAENKVAMYVKQIRQNYNGDLATQLKIDKSKFSIDGIKK